MSPAEVEDLARALRHRYPGYACGPTTPRDLALWCAALAEYTETESTAALVEWDRYHGLPPTLEEIVHRCKTVRSAATAWRKGLQEPRDLSPNQADFSRLMCELGERRVVARLTMRECAVQCLAWAEMNFHRPDLARDLMAAAAQYRALAADEVPAMWEGGV